MPDQKYTKTTGYVRHRHPWPVVVVELDEDNRGEPPGVPACCRRRQRPPEIAGPTPASNNRPITDQLQIVPED
jgi:hypothetical protein